MVCSARAGCGIGKIVDGHLGGGGVQHRIRQLFTVGRVLGKAGGTRIDDQRAVDGSGELRVGMTVDGDIRVQFTQSGRVRAVRLNVFAVRRPWCGMKHQQLEAVTLMFHKMWPGVYPVQQIAVNVVVQSGCFAGGT